VGIGRCVDDDIFGSIAEFLDLLDAAPDSLPHELSPRVASFLIEALSEGHDSSCVDVTLIWARSVIENSGGPDFGRLRARWGSVPELNGVNR
jgi:hypothetical protein